jgi:hypothetical protein
MLKRRLRALFRKTQMEQELDDEVRFNLEDGVGHGPNSHYWILRSHNDAGRLEPAFRRELRSIDADVGLANIRTMESYLADSVVPRRFSIRLLTIFSVAAVLLRIIQPRSGCVLQPNVAAPRGYVG